MRGMEISKIPQRVIKMAFGKFLVIFPTSPPATPACHVRQFGLCDSARPRYVSSSSREFMLISETDTHASMAHKVSRFIPFSAALAKLTTFCLLSIIPWQMA